MEQDEALEEGQISNSDDSDDYTPLERPSSYSAVQPNNRFPVIQESDSEIELQSSESDSDSDSGKQRSKKPKIKLKPTPKSQQPKAKKYDIWSTRVQEDVLAETMNSCDVTIKDRSRDVESYEFRNFHKRTNNKRTRNDRENSDLRLTGKSNNDEINAKGSSRTLLDLAVNINSSIEEIATDMSNKLYEEKEDLILKVIGAIGKEKSFELFKETKRIEAEGGMLIMNQTRRRTPGGVFLFLLRHDNNLTQEQRFKIFDDEKQKYKTIVKNKQKQKMRKMKQEIAASKAKLLPDLLTRAELLANDSNRVRKESNDGDVINPPPTPETDGHENSGDGMDGVNLLHTHQGNDNAEIRDRKVACYDDEFLELAGSNDMDLF